LWRRFAPCFHPPQSHMHKMINTPVIFKAEKDFEGDWQLNATAPAAKLTM